MTLEPSFFSKVVQMFDLFSAIGYNLTMEHEGRVATFATFTLFGSEVRVSLAYGTADLNLLNSLAQAREQNQGISPSGSQYEKEQFNAGIARLRKDLNPHHWRIVQTRARKELSSGKPGYYILEPEIQSANQPPTNLIPFEKRSLDVRQRKQTESVHPWITLDKSTRDQVTVEFRSDIASHIPPVRKANKIIKEIKRLKSSIEELKAKAQTASPSEQDKMLQAIGEAAEQQANLGGQDGLTKAEELLRIERNYIVRSVKTFKERVANASPNQQLALGQAPFLVPSQRQYSRPRLIDREPGSPILPHHDLGVLPDFRKPSRLSDNLEYALARTVVPNQQLVKAVLSLLPQHTFSNTASYSAIPASFRDLDFMVREAGNVARLLSQVEAGQFMRPTAFEVGKKSPEQRRHIRRYIWGVLADTLLEEIKSPHQSEDTIRKQYQQLSKNMRALAEWIGITDYGQTGYSMVTEEIEKLSDLEQSLLTSRLSLSLAKDLGYPGINLASERRLAEYLRTVTFTPKLMRESLIPRLIETLDERVEAEDINISGVFGDLETLPYGEKLVEDLFVFGDENTREMLLNILAASGCFISLHKDLYRRFLDEGENFTRDTEDYWGRPKWRR